MRYFNASSKEFAVKIFSDCCLQCTHKKITWTTRRPWKKFDSRHRNTCVRVVRTERKPHLAKKNPNRQPLQQMQPRQVPQPHVMHQPANNPAPAQNPAPAPVLVQPLQSERNQEASNQTSGKPERLQQPTVLCLSAIWSLVQGLSKPGRNRRLRASQPRGQPNDQICDTGMPAPTSTV